VMESE